MRDARHAQVPSRSPVVNYPNDEPLHADHRVQVPDRPGSIPRRRSSTSIRRPKATRTIRFRGRRTRRSTSSTRRWPTATPDVHFVGRLGTYKYYNMDQVVAQALTTFAEDRRRPPVRVRRLTDAETAPSSSGAASNARSIGWATDSSISSRGADITSALEDLDAVAALGIRTLRYPALVGADCPGWPGRCRLAMVRRGAGPPPRSRHRSHHRSRAPWQRPAVDPSARSGIRARACTTYAAAFAERYPWVRRYTPINEPLTTARFAALYGHWYPASARRTRVCRGLAESVLRDRGRHASDSRAGARRRVDPDRRCRLDPRGPPLCGTGRLRESAALAEPRSLERRGGRAPSPVALSVDPAADRPQLAAAARRTGLARR